MVSNRRGHNYESFGPIAVLPGDWTHRNPGPYTEAQVRTQGSSRYTPTRSGGVTTFKTKKKVAGQVESVGEKRRITRLRQGHGHINTPCFDRQKPTQIHQSDSLGFLVYYLF